MNHPMIAGEQRLAGEQRQDGQQLARDELGSNELYLEASLRWLRTRFSQLESVTWNPGAVEVITERQAAAERRACASLVPTPEFITLSHRFGLSTFEQDVLLLCLAVELDPDTGRRCAAATGETLPYPTFALCLQLFDDPAWEALSPFRPLRADRLVTLAGREQLSLISSPLRIEEAVLHVAKGLLRVRRDGSGWSQPHLDERLAARFTAEPPTPSILAPSHAQARDTLLAQWCSATPPVINLVGPSPIDARQVARAAAAELGADLFRCSAAELDSGTAEELAALWQRDRQLHEVVLLVEAADLGPDTGHGIARFLDRAGGRQILVSRDAAALALRSAPVVIDLDRASPREQQAIWSAALPDGRSGIADRLANRFRLDSETITELAGTAHGCSDAELELLWRRCRAVSRPPLAGAVNWIEPRAGWQDLVLPAETTTTLHDITAQVRNRNRVLYDWGFADRSARGWGTSVLLSGPPGTGKSLTAEVLANDLDVAICQVDLAAVVSKYIGETEKNLARIFDAADVSNALLLFDEADALFGRRTEVRDSHDRYANIEVSYLLQRLETFRGLAVLTTNLATSMDAAFVRRLRFLLPYAFPGAPERRRMWARAFPVGVPTVGLDLDRMATLPTNGATIANIAMHAAFAAAEADQPVTQELLLRAARRELTKTGQALPAELRSAASA